MQENQQYLKYKPKLKQHCIVMAVASGVSLLAVIYLIFIPFFRINLLDAKFDSTSLPKLEGLNLEALFSANPHIDFSIFDELVASIGNLTGGATSDPARVSGVWIGMFQILGMIFLVIGLVASMVSLVKNILRVISPDDYALDTYDKLKRRIDENKRRRYYYSASYWVVIGLVYEVFAIVISTVYGNVLGTEYVGSYFSLVTGLNGWCVLTIVFILAVFALFIWASIIKKNVRIEIMREEYNVKNNEETVG